MLPHTEAKHSILRGYLGAWFPKLAWKGRLLFIDGFAGPGEYSKGEPGSPIIALRAALDHKADLSNCELVFVFIEENASRFANLTELIDAIELPPNIDVQMKQAAFADIIGDALDDLERSGAPALVMVDPFGFEGMPMVLLKRIAGHQRSELLISFMYESVNRWLSQPQLASGFDELFGIHEWRKALNLASPRERLDFLHDLYVTQLKDAGMTYVHSFLMLDSGNRPEYFLIFATKNIDGLKAMKRAMWRVAPSGNLQFSDATNRDQMTLFAPTPDYAQLKRQIIGHFGKGSVVSVEGIELFVVTETAFLDSHYKRAILSPMEKNQELEILETSRQRKGNYPPGTILRFL